MQAPAWNISLIGVCALSLLVWLVPGRMSSGPPPGRIVGSTLLLLSCYIAFQLIPLPLEWVRILSPARAALASATFPPGAKYASVALSATPTLTMAHLLRVLCFICVFFLIRELTRRLDRRPWLTSLPVILIAAGEATLGLVQYFRGAAQAAGTYVNQNHYSSFLQMALPLPLALAAVAMRRKPGRETRSLSHILLSCLLLACAALIFAGALYSMSRMGAAAIAASLLVVTIFIGTRNGAGKRASIAIAFGAIAVALLFFVAAPGPLLAHLGNGQLSGEVRFQIWRETLRMVADYPIFGSGLGSYASVFQKYSASAPLNLVDYAHNDYLQLLAERGVTGVAIACLAAISIILGILRCVWSGKSTMRRLIAAACAASFVALLLDCSVDFDFYIPANAMLAAWIAGIGTAFTQPASQTRTD